MICVILSNAHHLTDSSGNTTLANLVTRNSYTGNRMRSMPMETVTYDACGRLTGASSGRVRSIRYNEIGLPLEMELSDGSVVSFAYGELIEDANMAEGTSSDNRYRFTGKELATETGLYDFCARYLETSMGRFTTIDPLAEKYPSVSPYAYCAGDPVNRVDPDGRRIYDADGNVVTYDLKNGWSSNADPIFVEIASLMQKYHSGSAIINSMLSSQVKYTVTFIDTLFPENSKKWGKTR